jgi:hypothetical protein
VSDGDPGWGYQEYRVSESAFGWVLVMMAFGAVALLVSVCTDAAMPGPLKAGVLGVGLAAFAAVPVWAWLSRTVRGPDGLAVRGLLRTRTFAWPDIQDIRIEPNPAAQLGFDSPRNLAFLYDGAGRRVALPHLNEKNLAKLGLTLATEVEAIRSAWHRQRGPHWAPLPRAQRRIDQHTRYPFASWMVGMLAAMLTVPVAVLIVVVGLFTHAAELPAPLSWLFRPEAILVLPAVVFPVAAVASKLARRRAAPR